MPNRMLRDWTGSDKINSISVHAERFFVRLIMKVDDYGCFYADPRLLKANLFPLLLDSIRDADMLRWAAECQKAGLIVVYENDNKRFLQIQDFKQRLDRAKSKYPLPTANDLRDFVNEFPPEQKGTEEEGKGTHAHEFFKIEDCFTIALKDSRWVKANKATPEDLAEFNRHLESKAIYQKKPDDYKSHFASWKKKEYKPQQAGSGQKTVNEFL